VYYKDESMRVAITVCYVLLILLGVSFAALNATSVEVNLYVTKLVLPISVFGNRYARHWCMSRVLDVFIPLLAIESGSSQNR